MKKSFLVILTVLLLATLLAPAAYCQNEKQVIPLQQEARTKLESFQRQAGTVVIKGYSEVGTVAALGSVEVTAMEFTDATSKRQQMGIRIEVKEGVGRFENTDSSFIDSDEIEPLLKGIDYISKVTSDVTQLSEFEATYKTRGDFKVSTFSGSGKVEAAVSSGYVRPVSVFLSIEQLQELRAIISQAKQRLDAIRSRPTKP